MLRKLASPSRRMVCFGFGELTLGLDRRNLCDDFRLHIVV
jgi:hypothetical protein